MLYQMAVALSSSMVPKVTHHVSSPVINHLHTSLMHVELV